MSREKKKLTRKQMEDKILRLHEKTNKEFHLKGLSQGYNISNEMILDYINKGHDLEEVKSFIEKNVSEEGKNVFDKMLMKK